MKKTIQFQMPLTKEDSFELLCRSAKDILSWSLQTRNLEAGQIEWKQSIWSLTGTAMIVAKLEQQSNHQTSVVVDVIKPFQLIDPFNLCGRIFKKLEKSVEKNYSLLKENKLHSEPPSPDS